MLLSYWSEAELHSSKQTYSWTPGEMVAALSVYVRSFTLNVANN